MTCEPSDKDLPSLTLGDDLCAVVRTCYIVSFVVSYGPVGHTYTASFVMGYEPSSERAQLQAKCLFVHRCENVRHRETITSPPFDLLRTCITANELDVLRRRDEDAQYCYMNVQNL